MAFQLEFGRWQIQLRPRAERQEKLKVLPAVSFIASWLPLKKEATRAQCLWTLCVLNRSIAITGADRDALAANGAATAQHGRASLGLHARAKAVGLGAMAAVWLKCALGHGNALLLLFENLSQFGKIQVYRRLSQESSSVATRGRHRRKADGMRHGCLR